MNFVVTVLTGLLFTSVPLFHLLLFLSQNKCENDCYDLLLLAVLHLFIHCRSLLLSISWLNPGSQVTSAIPGYLLDRTWLTEWSAKAFVYDINDLSDFDPALANECLMSMQQLPYCCLSFPANRHGSAIFPMTCLSFFSNPVPKDGIRRVLNN